MSLEHLKKQSKNAQKLLSDYGVAGPVKLATAQEFVARLNGYPDWHNAIQSQSKKDESPPKRTTSNDLWFLKFEYFAKGDELTDTEVRVMEGAADALGMLWQSFGAFDGELEYPGTPDGFKLSLQPCSEPNALTGECLQLDYAATHRSLRVRIYPIDHRIVMLNGPYTKPIPEIADLLKKMKSNDDMETLFTAASVPYEIIKKELVEYHDAHPAKGMFQSLETFLQKELKAKAKTQDPADAIWTCDSLRLGRWRFAMKFHAGNFYFEAFDEGGGNASLFLPSEQGAFKRKASGQWVAGQFKGKGESAVLAGVTDDSMDQLRSAAKDWGVGFVIDGITELAPVSNGAAPSHVKFYDWLGEKHPEVLKRYKMKK